MNTCCRSTSRWAPPASNFEATRFHAGIDEFVLAMDSFAFRRKERT